MTENSVLIKAEKLVKKYRLPAEDVFAVNQVDISIREGEFVSLMGPSGSGKTTLLDLIGCLDTLSNGKLIIMGRDVSHATEGELVAMRRGRFGFVFQEFLLVPELTALENVELPLVFARMPIDRDKVRHSLEMVGLGHRMNHLPKEMSGGERQRVAIARALVTEPKILLADEPTGQLDSKNSEEVYSILSRLNRERGLTIIVATHNEKLGNRATRIVNLQDGKIISDK